MTNVLDIVQQTLDAGMYAQHGVTSHWLQLRPAGDDNPTEYIVYRLVSTTAFEFADGKPLDIRQPVDVNYYANAEIHSRTHIQERVRQIRLAMLTAGFTCPEEDSDLINPDDDGIVGKHMEFWMERMRDCGWI